MKHVFGCGLVGESNRSPQGDAFLARMIGAEQSDQQKQWPEDFSIEFDPCAMFRFGDFILANQMLELFGAEMVKRGYRWIRYREAGSFAETIRFVTEAKLARERK